MRINAGIVHSQKIILIDHQCGTGAASGKQASHLGPKLRYADHNVRPTPIGPATRATIPLAVRAAIRLSPPGINSRAASELLTEFYC